MFRPCIDLHEGKVKQIVGGTLESAGDDGSAGALKTNFVSEHPSRYYAELYRKDDLSGGHIIMLGPGNEAAAREALAAWPGGMQVGGGINLDNAQAWLDAGASHVIVTSWVFRDGKLNAERLAALVKAVGRERLVLDLSCRKRGGKYWVAMNRWRDFTDLEVNDATLRVLGGQCAEYLVHAVDVEGKQEGIDLELVEQLARWSTIPVTYAGGARSLEDLDRVEQAGSSRVDLTIGSALDIFGGPLPYADVVAWNRARCH
ncbi:MAG: phosphoribosylformimino-5-aminoimidazole carboxamide ribotide isomerase [Candidatus Sumerlaeota bacterium]|nr:phosphoribosylformimino-5-aminoimidazole carboxamide ribotide isomerase [Candidatus Sumerlaeota bacterium]